MDPLERYIVQHQDQLDVFDPNLMTETEFEKYMEDGLTHFIKAKRRGLDHREPSEKVWENIKNELNNQEYIPSAEHVSALASSSLNVYAPSDKVWDKLSAALDDQQSQTEEQFEHQKKTKTISISILWQVAAAAIILGLGIGFVFSEMNHQRSPLSSEQILAKYAPDMVDAHRYYMDDISTMQTSIAMIGFEDSVLLQDFHEEIIHLDEEYDQLIQEFPTAPDPDLVKFGLMENLKLRIALLNKQLEIIDQVNQTKNKQDNEGYKL